MPARQEVEHDPRFIGCSGVCVLEREGGKNRHPRREATSMQPVRSIVLTVSLQLHRCSDDRRSRDVVVSMRGRE